MKMGDLAVPVRFEGVASHFPTLRPDRDPFLLVDLTDYQNYVRRLPVNSLDRPDEMWLSLDPAADRQEVHITDSRSEYRDSLLSETASVKRSWLAGIRWLAEVGTALRSLAWWPSGSLFC